MKKGQVYMCGDCGLEIEVVKECDSCVGPDDECVHETCSFVCCDKPLTLKE
jgi:hypothetical protein